MEHIVFATAQALLSSRKLYFKTSTWKDTLSVNHIFLNRAIIKSELFSRTPVHI